MTTALQSSLAERVEALAAMPSDAALPPDAEGVVEQLLGALERGEVRSAERGSDGTWNAVTWVKRGILLGGAMSGKQDHEGNALGRHALRHSRFVRLFNPDHSIRTMASPPTRSA